MIDLNPTTLWQLVNFFVIMFLLNIVVYKPVRNMLKKRAEHNAQMQADINDNQEAAHISRETLAASQAETRNKGLVMWDEAKIKARAEELGKLQEANTANVAFMAQQRAEINAQIEMAGAKLDSEVEQFARDIAGKLLQRNLS